MKKVVLVLLAMSFWLLAVSQAKAQGNVLGIHILHPYELEDAKELLGNESGDNWDYVTIPLTLDDLDQAGEWQRFFDQARDKKIIPLVRLATKSENANWKKPTREEVVQLLDFANTLQWPTDQRHIIVFNEVNHAQEWGGTINPEEYAEILRFTSLWAKSQRQEFIVLPAALDLAAPNGPRTMEAFTYLNRMYAADPDIFALVDYWNSHSYPNPAFSSPPERYGQNSLRGFTYELEYLQRKTGREYQVFITETGWAVTPYIARRLESYYTYALRYIWSDPRIVAVTPFLLRGDPGPFKTFTFLDSDNQPTLQYQAMQKAVAKTRPASPSAQPTDISATAAASSAATQ